MKDKRIIIAPFVMVRLGAQVTAAIAVLAGRALTALGLRRPPEGWRRTVGILLRSEATRFALSAFGLRVPPANLTTSGEDPLEARTALALLSFLAGEADAHFALEWRGPVTLRHRIANVAVVVLRFGADGTLDAIDPYLSAASTGIPPREAQTTVHDAIVAAYNRTAGLPETERTPRLVAHVRAAIESSAAGRPDVVEAYARRVLSASCLSFETRDLANPAQRFCPPSFSQRRTLGNGYLSWVGRLDRDRESVDLWVSAHHVGLDGVPLQDLLERLERAWGTAAGAVTFPPAVPGRAFAGPHRCHVPGERPVDQLLTFVDLSPLLSLRGRLNAQQGATIGGHVTLGGLVAWLLAQEPEFSGVRIASTVDVAASGGYDRDVDVVSLRPADYVTGPGAWDGFISFIREFNRLVAAARARTSPVRVGMQTAGLIPAWAHATLVRANPASLDDTFGSLCVTIVRDARVFIAPMTDLGLGHGFFAIGSAALPSGTGRRVTAVSVKGEAGRIAHYPAILQRMLDRCSALLAD
jgi:hypothetical protein